MLAAAERHTELAGRLTPRSELEQVLLDRGVKDPMLLERAAAADRLTRQVMADVNSSQPRSPAAARAPRQATARQPGAAQVRGGAERQPGVSTRVKAGVMPEPRPEPGPVQAEPAQLEETGAHAQRARCGAAVPGLAGAGRSARAA